MFRDDVIAPTDLLAAVEQAADGIVITDIQGRIRYVNPEFSRMTGYTSKEVIGKHPRILKSGSHSQYFYKELWSTILSGRTWSGDVVNRRKDGTLYQERMRITPVRSPVGEIDSFIAIKQDVSELRAAEKAQRFLAGIAESAKDAIFACSPAGVILTWNSGAESIFAYNSAEVIGQHVSTLMPPERIPYVLQYITRISRGGERVYEQRGLGLRKDGTKIYVSVSAGAVKDSSDEVTAISVMLRDVSEQYRAEQAQALLASIVESSDDAILGATLDGTVVSWNRGAESLFGYSTEELIGKSMAILAPVERQGEITSTLATVRQGRLAHRYESVRRKKDSSLVHVSIGASPIRNPAGDVVGCSFIYRDIGERVETERKLHESTERFHEVFEHAPFGIGVTGLDGSFLQVNEALCRMLGYSRKELLETSWMKLIHPDDRDPARQRLKELLAGQVEFLDGERRYIQRSGSVVCGRVRVSLVKNSKGQPLYFVTHGEDVTERNRNKEALKESEARFRLMADGCPAMIFVTNAEGETEFINQAYQKFCGCSDESVREGKWQLLLHPDDAPAYVDAFRRAVRDQTPFHGEGRVRNVNGEWRWIAAYAGPRFSPSGEYLGHVGLCPDITERKLAEQALQISEEKFRQFAENVHEVFWMMSPEANEILYINPAYERIWGRTCDSLYRNPMSWAHAIHPDDREHAHEIFARQIAGEIVDSEYRIITTAGQEKWILDQAFPVRNEAGELIRIVGIAEEITARKHYEQELIRAREGALAGSRAKSAFLALMSHEIRTPLNAILGMADVLSTTPLNSQQQMYVETFRRSGATLLTLINDILDLSKIEAGQMTLEKAPFELGDLCNEVVGLFRPKASDSGIDLKLELDPVVDTPVLGDSARLQQILQNLLANAIKFTPSGTVKLTVTRDRAAGTVSFEVSDTGIGIPDDKLSLIFDNFKQADSSMTRKYGGTGLGLGICRRLVDLMGGNITVQSTPGSGSTFRFSIPLDEAGESTAVKRNISAGDNHSACELGGGHQSQRILIAEDVPENQLVLEAYLGPAGHELTFVEDGEQAVDKAAHEDFDLILMDIRMPVMDGLTATRKIREREVSQGRDPVPIIALTADAGADDAEQSRLAGCDAHLTKPIKRKVLLATVGNYSSSAVRA